MLKTMASRLSGIFINQKCFFWILINLKISYLPHSVYLQHVVFQKEVANALLVLEFLHHYVVCRFEFLMKHRVKNIKLYSNQIDFAFYLLCQNICNNTSK